VETIAILRAVEIAENTRKKGSVEKNSGVAAWLICIS
jgi:hypothetical protein